MHVDIFLATSEVEVQLCGPVLASVLFVKMPRELLNDICLLLQTGVSEV